MQVRFKFQYRRSMIKKYADISGKLDTIRKSGTPKGEATGFKTLDNLFTIKEGSFTFILAPPHNGKSEFSFDLLINRAHRGEKALICSPETGGVEDIYAELIHKFTGKRIYEGDWNILSEKQYYSAINWIDHNFSIVDTEDKAFSFDELFGMVTDEKNILADPMNEMNHEAAKEYGGRQDLYLEDLCSKIRRYNRKNKKHTIITLHPAKQTLKEEKIKGQTIRYYPMPLAREAAWGEALFRKAMTWINLWRPPVGLKHSSGRLYKDNEVIFMVEKARPKGAAKKGIDSLYFDIDRNCFYEEYDGNNCYAFQHEDASKFNYSPV